MHCLKPHPHFLLFLCFLSMREVQLSKWQIKHWEKFLLVLPFPSFLYLFVLKRKSVRIFLLNLPYELICIKQNKDTAFMLHICFISIVSVLLNHEEIVS